MSRLRHADVAIGRRRGDLEASPGAVGEARRPGIVAVVAPGIRVAVTDLVSLREKDGVGRAVGYRSWETALALRRHRIARFVDEPEDQKVGRVARRLKPALVELM